MEKNALDLLRDGELCKLITVDGEQEARWSKTNRCFYFTDYDESGREKICSLSAIKEWLQASIKF